MIRSKYAYKSFMEDLKLVNQLIISRMRILSNSPDLASVIDITQLLVDQKAKFTSMIEDLLKEVKDPATISLYQFKMQEINSVTSLTSIDNQTVGNGVNAGNREDKDEGDRDDAQSP